MNPKNIEVPLVNEIVHDDTLLELLAYRGSITHGMYVPNSDPNSTDDIDLMGVVTPPWKNYYAINGDDKWSSNGTRSLIKGEFDFVYYEITKFINLLLKGNPNVICMLWLNADDYLATTDMTAALIKNREWFNSMRICNSFSGYAYGQLMKMEKFSRKGYMGEKRKALVLKHGYDTKNAAHSLRLLRMGREFAKTGEFRVNRSGIDADYLLSVKRGEFGLDEIKAIAEDEFEKFRAEIDRCNIRKNPETEKVKELVWSYLRE